MFHRPVQPRTYTARTEEQFDRCPPHWPTVTVHARGCRCRARGRRHGARAVCENLNLRSTEAKM